MKTLKQFLDESSDSHKEVADFMNKRYQDVAPDLPKHGNYHHASAVDHLGDSAYDHFGPNHPARPHLKTIAHQVVSRYAEDDSKESRANERKRFNAAKVRAKVVRAKKPPKVKNWDDRPPRNKGVGSF